MSAARLAAVLATLYLICGLSDAPSCAGIDDPAQARDANVDGEWIDEVFGAEGDGANGAESWGGRRLRDGEEDARAQQSGLQESSHVVEWFVKVGARLQPDRPSLSTASVIEIAGFCGHQRCVSVSSNPELSWKTSQ